MRVLIFTLFLLLMSCSTDIHNYEEMKLSSHMQNMFPDGISNVDNEKADLRLLQDKALALYFTSSNNPQSPEFERLLSDMVIKYDYRLAVVVVNVGPSYEDFLEQVEKYGSDFFIVSDKRAKSLRSEYKIMTAPTLIVFGRNGKLIDEDGVESLVNDYPRIPVAWE
ncbi:thioredoxin family protein [Lentisphaera profundi]|uniref:Thioredoxin family protein n=1 Tax=Lentisphaera profundi TaxID=1658616 RepID=A0ABY7VXQ0_9BACT|nr:thioredoxin family protein [Lentisphaera profundi]WDE98701.1 thioredoxin family protein [Lentisphaera profundi]